MPEVSVSVGFQAAATREIYSPLTCRGRLLPLHDNDAERQTSRTSGHCWLPMRKTAAPIAEGPMYPLLFWFSLERDELVGNSNSNDAASPHEPETGISRLNRACCCLAFGGCLGRTGHDFSMLALAIGDELVGFKKANFARRNAFPAHSCCAPCAYHPLR
jgi:hypothetical protein